MTYKPVLGSADDLPQVSLLIAARNEARNIIRCLRSVAALDYPETKLLVLIGDDNSEDETASLIRSFIADKPAFKLIHITAAQPGGKLQGKTNVLAQLAHRAQGDYLFYTDADIALPSAWLKTMLAPLQAGAGIVTGVTVIEGNSLFYRFQSLDWLTATSVISLLAQIKVPVTAIGNNMALRADAYNAVGGYEAIPFSLTEDHALFIAVLEKGYGFAHLFSSHVTALSTPQPDLPAWFSQHKRWMYGAMQVHPLVRALFFGQFLTYPFCLVLAFFKPGIALTLALCRYIPVTLYAATTALWLRQFKAAVATFLYDPLFCILYPILIIRYFTNRNISWKGRSYAGNEPIQE
ncbi:MAG: glycosyltransferase [Bacteroidota bacterium]